MQVGMVATLLAAIPVDFVSQLACSGDHHRRAQRVRRDMDVAIDSLAVDVLPEAERGSANGFMFGGASVGQTVGGSSVLFLIAVMPFQVHLPVRDGVILAVTVFIVLPLHETTDPRGAAGRAQSATSPASSVDFVVDAYRAFTGSRAAPSSACSIAVLPAGAYALSLSLQSTLAVELGLDDNEVAS